MKTEKKRLMSIDALRGFDMLLFVACGPIFRALPEVNSNPVNHILADQFRHPPWHGFTVYDLIFPLFIFIVGVALPFSLSSRVVAETGKRNVYRRIVIRLFVFAILGALLWRQPGLSHPVYGYYSVLFRIGVAYFFTALIMMNFSIRAQVFWTFGLSLGYWALMRFVPVPGFGAGDYSQEASLVTHVRLWVADYISPDFQYVFNITLIGSLTNALFGVLAGHLLKSAFSELQKTKWLLIGGLALTALGLLVHLEIPINKNAWSTSFIFFTSGISSLLLGLFYWMIDVKGWHRWAFILVVVGVNSIAIYVAHYLIPFNLLAESIIGRIDFGDATVLVVAMVLSILKWLFCYYLYRQKFFFKV